MADIEIDIEELTKPFPPEALSQREGGRGKQLTYIKTHAVINRLNRACRYRWEWRIIDQHFEGDIFVCRGELTIPGLGTRAGVGVQKVQGQEDLFKGASSDAMKKAATLFGVGIELYGDDVEAEEYTPRPQPPQQFRQGPAFPSQRRQAPPPADTTEGEVKPCFKCRKPVRYAIGDQGKQDRFNADGSLHFRVCGNGPTGYEAAGEEEADPFAGN